MSFRDDMIDIFQKESETLGNRTNKIDQENYKKLYDCLFTIIKERMKGRVENRYFTYDQKLFSRKNYRYQIGYGIRITISLHEAEDFRNEFNVYNIREFDDTGGWIHLKTAYLDDIENSFLYLFEKSNQDKFDHILFSWHKSEYDFRHSGTYKEFTFQDINYIIEKIKQEWKQNPELKHNRSSCIDHYCTIIAQIACNQQGIITKK